MYSVYKHTNLQNGKVYIGITKQQASRRWHGGQGYCKQPLFYNAILKYGWDGFSHEILSTGLSQEDAFQIEKDLIQKYNSTDRKFGYNIASGGLDETTFTPDYRKSLSKARRNRPPMSIETRLKISKSRLGIKLPPRSEDYRKRLSTSLKGRIFSEEHCRNISLSKRGKYAGRNNPNAKAVRCIETGKIYACMKEAEFETGASNHNISSVCNGRLKTTGGYHWEYV